MVKKHVQTYCVAITVKIKGYPHPTPKYQLQDDTFFFSRVVKGDRVGCCFLRDVDVCGSRIAEPHESVLLRPRQLGLDMTVQEIVAGLQSAAPCISGKLNVQSIGVKGFVERSTCPPFPQLLHETLGVVNDIILFLHPFLGLPCHPLLERSGNRCLKKLASAPPVCRQSFYPSQKIC
jgi:hypothetical protein